MKPSLALSEGPMSILDLTSCQAFKMTKKKVNMNRDFAVAPWSLNQRIQ